MGFPPFNLTTYHSVDSRIEDIRMAEVASRGAVQMAIVRREVSDRTPVGKFFKYLFIAFNILMPILLFAGCAAASNGIANAGAGSDYPDAATAGATIGAGLAMGSLLFVWLVGDVVLGLLVLFTRRKKIVEVDE
ncbi:MAG TPA: hypothetical protein VN713_10190 [Sphingomicrobium sp.]|nr:hypothetical protein [Sphingomicrobium sp.]